MKQKLYHLVAIAVTIIISISTIASKAQPATGFVTIWKPGQTMGKQSIKLPIIGTDMDIYWEEVGYPLHNGSLRNMSNMSKTYSSVTFIDFGLPMNPIAVNATYRVKINRLQQYYSAMALDQAPLLLEVQQWGKENKFTSMDRAFVSCTNLTLTARDVPDLSLATSMGVMFSGCNNLRDVNGSMKHWDTSTITDMNVMFQNAHVFNGDIGSWNTSNVVYMHWMFQNAYVFNGDISKWDTSKAAYMNGMFYKAEKFNSDISAWNTSSVVNMTEMFNMASSFNQEIGRWNTSKVSNMNWMFASANDFNGNISKWNTSNVVFMANMFNKAGKFNQDIGSWNTARVAYMNSIFNGATSFNQNLRNWHLCAINGAGMTGMFDGSGMDCQSYSSTLIGWAGNATTPGSVELGATGMVYSGTEATEARNMLVASQGWKINGDTFNETTCTGIAPEMFKDVPKANVTNNMLQVYWETFAGNGTDHFEIEVSKDGETWQKAGENIQGKANGIKAGTVIGYQSQIPFQQVALIAFSVLALGFVATKKIHKNYRIILSVLTFTALIYSCSKNNETVCQQYQDMFVRIKHINTEGKTNYSKIVKVKSE